MRRELTLLLTVALTVFAALVIGCGTGKRSNMERLLAEADSMNRNYIPFTTDSVMLDVVDYYDRHGTPNERMRAHYLLGCVYRDLGEAPHAVDCYLNAIAEADTTSADCDFHTLGCVYSQMGDVFHRQLLLTEEITARKKSQYYAEMEGETLNAISSLKLSAGAYILLNKRDTAEAILNDVVHLYMNNGYEQEAIQTSLMLMHLFVDKPEKLAELKSIIIQYDYKSNLFDEDHELPPYFRQFNYYKGKYFENVNNLDSAEYYYRKVYGPNMPYHAKDPMYKGLLSVFRKRHQADSIAKYSQLYCETNDSSIIIKDQQQTAQLAASYDYHYYKEQSLENENKAERFKTTLIIVAALFVILVLLFTIAYIRNRDEKRRLEERIRLLRGYSVNERLYNSPIACRFRQMLKENPYRQPNLDEWKELALLIDREIPDFRKKLNVGIHPLGEIEYDVCMLIKIQISSSDIARLKQCTPSYVTQIRKKVYQMLFSKKGRADELDEYIMSLS